MEDTIEEDTIVEDKQISVARIEGIPIPAWNVMVCCVLIEVAENG